MHKLVRSYLKYVLLPVSDQNVNFSLIRVCVCPLRPLFNSRSLEVLYIVEYIVWI